MCVLISSVTFFLKHFSLQEELDEILLKIYIGFNLKYPILLSDCNETWIFSKDSRKILKYQIS